MDTWTKSIARPTKVNIAFAILSFVGLLVIAWSRTDFSSPPTVPTADLNSKTAAFYSPLEVRVGASVAESPSVISNATETSTTSNRTSVPSLPAPLKVEPQQTPTSAAPLGAVVKPVLHTVDKVITPIVTILTDQQVLAPIMQESSPSEGCSSLLVLELCRN